MWRVYLLYVLLAPAFPNKLRRVLCAERTRVGIFGIFRVFVGWMGGGGGGVNHVPIVGIVHFKNIQTIPFGDGIAHGFSLGTTFPV